MEKLFSDEDLKDLLAEYQEETEDEEVVDSEIEASQRRFQEIIKKHRE